MNDRGVHFFDVASGKLRFVQFCRVRHNKYHFAFHPNGNYLAIISGTHLIIFDIISRKEIADLRLPKKHFLHAAFTCDGRYLATVSLEETVKF